MVAMAEFHRQRIASALPKALLCLLLAGALGTQDNRAFSQFSSGAGAEAHAGGGGKGFFEIYDGVPDNQDAIAGGDGRVSGGNLLFELTLGFSIKQGVSPGMTYAVVNKRGGARFAYYCIVRHKYSDTVRASFPYDLFTWDEQGRIEQSLVVGKLSCPIAYSITVDNMSKDVLGKEKLAVNGTDIDLGYGRVLFIDMTGNQIVITQAAMPSIATKKTDIDATAGRLLSELSQSLRAGTLTTRVLKSAAAAK